MKPETTFSDVQNPDKKRIILRMIAFCLVIFGGMIAVHNLIFAILMGLTKLTLGELMRLMATKEGVYFLGIMQIFALAVTLTIVSLFREQLDKRSVYSLGWEMKGREKDFVLGLLLGFLLMAVGFVVLCLLGFLTVSKIQFQPLLMLFYVFLCVLVSVNEELMIRGYLLNNLMGISNKYTALIISSLIFAFMHAMSPNLTAIGFLNIVLAGVLLGIYYIHQVNLWFPLALHFSWNFFQGPIFGFEVSGIALDGLITQELTKANDWLTGGNFGFEGSILVTIMMILSIVVIHFNYRN